MLTPSRKQLGKSLARGKKIFASHALRSTRFRAEIVNQFCSLMKREIKSVSSQSLLNVRVNRSALSNFTWDGLHSDLLQKAPLLCKVLSACIPSNSKYQHKVCIVMCIAILAKARHSSASLIQRMTSVLLYTGHAGKQVCCLEFLKI